MIIFFRQKKKKKDKDEFGVLYNKFKETYNLFLTDGQK